MFSYPLQASWALGRALSKSYQLTIAGRLCFPVGILVTFTILLCIYVVSAYFLYQLIVQDRFRELPSKHTRTHIQCLLNLTFEIVKPQFRVRVLPDRSFFGLGLYRVGSNEIVLDQFSDYEFELANCFFFHATSKLKTSI